MTELISFIYSFAWTNGEGLLEGQPLHRKKHLLEMAMYKQPGTPEVKVFQVWGIQMLYGISESMQFAKCTERSGEGLLWDRVHCSAPG